MCSHHTQQAHIPSSLPQYTLLHPECLPQPLQSGERLIIVWKPYSKVTSVKWSLTLSHPLFWLPQHFSPPQHASHVTYSPMHIPHIPSTPPAPRHWVPKEPGQCLTGLCIHYTQNGAWYMGRGSINERLIQSVGDPPLSSSIIKPSAQKQSQLTSNIAGG